MTDLGTTPRKPLTPRQRLKLFEDEKGLCCICGLKIVGKFIDEHKRALALGGSNDLDNRGVAHPKCAAVKTHDEDMPRIVKAKAQKRAAHGIKAAKGKPIQSAAFAKVEKPARSDRKEKIDKNVFAALGPPNIMRRFRADLAKQIVRGIAVAIDAQRLPPSAQEATMDLDKLVEDGARAICVEMGNDPDEDVSMSFDPTTPKPMWECFTNEARAVLAIALAAAAEADEKLKNGDLMLAAGEMTASELRTVRAVLNWRAAHRRTIATQLGGKTDG